MGTSVGNLPGYRYQSDGDDVALGIDLGTTYSVVGVYYVRDQDLIGEIVTNQQGNRLTPSVVSLATDGVLVGEAAMVCRRQASEGLRESLHQVLKDVPFFKSLMDWFERRELDSKSPNIDAFEGKVCVNYQGSQSHCVGSARGGHQKAVITVLAYFSDAVIWFDLVRFGLIWFVLVKSTLIAGQIAGLDVLRLVKAPTAAAISYAMKLNNFKQSERLLVFDFGGGTLEVSILDYDGGRIEVQAVSGDSNLGGENFDQVLTDHLMKLLKQQLQGQELKKPKRIRAQLIQAAERAKKQLSHVTVTDVVVDGIVNAIVSEVFEKIKPVVQNALTQAGCGVNDINRVLLFGRSSRIPKVQEIVKDMFEQKVYLILNLDEAVADGAAILAFKLKPSFTTREGLLETTCKAAPAKPHPAPPRSPPRTEVAAAAAARTRSH
eukprot:g46481.t1